MDDKALQALLVIPAFFGFCVMFTLLWSGIVMLIGRMSGWTGLGARYATTTPVLGLGAGAVRFGMANYNHTIRLEPRVDGLAMDVMGLFRPGHKPLLIPWSDVRIAGAAKVSFFVPGMRLELGPDRVGMVIPEAAWAQIEADARRYGAVG